jgi:hypothetical protein
VQSVWWLYLIVFVFGYWTCKTFYFIKEARLGLTMVKISHCLSLYCLVRGIESLEYARSIRVFEMQETGVSERNVQAFNLNFDDEVKRYKDKAIRQIVDIHPSFYKDIVDFEDWESAMKYLNEEGTEYIKRFTKDTII